MKTTSRSAVLQDLVSTVEQLFPGSAVSAGLLRNGQRAFRLVPGPRRPRMLVPAGSRPAAADSVNRPSAHDSFRRSLQRRVLSTALGSPLGAALMPFGLNVTPGSGSISDYLSEKVNAPVVLSLMVGSPRANRKPVLNVHLEDGREIGFAKVGLNELTNRLVDHESRTLQTLAAAESAEFAVPKVIHAGQWRGNAVLLMTALRPVGRHVQHGAPVRAAAAIAATAPVEILAVEESGWYNKLRGDVQILHGTRESALPELLDAFGERYAGLELPFGAWHGDFGAWNFAPTGGRLLVWDWERYDQDVPLGLDVVHYVAHPALRTVGDLGAARRSLATGCRPALAQVVGSVTSPTYGGDPAVLDALVLGYLLTITARFTFDSLTTDGSAVHTLARWHQRVLADLLEQPALTAVKRGDHVVD